MFVIKLRLSKEENELIKSYADFLDMTMSDFIKSSAVEKIEDLIDIQAVEEYKKLVRQGNRKIYTHDEVLKENGLI